MAKRKRKAERTTIELPAPTYWPMVLALGVAFIFAGIVTTAAVSLVGAVLAAAGGLGWWRDVFPGQRLEVVEVEVAAAAPAAAAAPLEPGRAGHRMRLPEEIHPYASGVRAGLAGAVAMAVVACGYGLIAHGSLWFPINLLAAMAMPGLTAAGDPELDAFHPGALVVATMIHAISSVLIGLLYTVILPMMPRRPLLLGGVITPVLWTALLYPVMGIVNPALDEHVNWWWFLASQFAYGIAAGAIIARSSRIKTRQLVPLSQRLRLERSRGGAR